MGQGYTRNDTSNNIADGNIINASDLDGEFDAVEAAFNSSTGHTHDGTSAEGAPITVMGPVQDFVVSTTEIKPKTTNTLDIGTSGLQFKDLYLDGTANIDSLVADTANIDGGTIDGTTIGASSAAAITGTIITGTSFVSSGNMTFGDNNKAIFGAGSDLQIYSDGSTSYITEAGPGNLRINGASVQITDTSFNKYFQGSGDTARLYYADGEKLATTSGGIDVTGTITFDGGTTSADLNFGDNDKAIFGAGSDLQIYHDGTDSIIKESGGGDLQLWGDDIRLMSADGTETMLRGNPDAQIQFYYDNAVKLATTATGVDVTGTVTADGLTVDGASVFNQAASDQSGGAAVKANGTAYGSNKSIHAFMDTSNSAKSLIYAENGAGSVFNVDGAGDVSLYASDGTTQGFFWDASAESLGIGTTSPSNPLHVVGSNNQIRLGVSGSYYMELAHDKINTINAAQNPFKIQRSGNDQLVITHGGNVGIGTSSPAQALDIETGSVGSLIRISGSTSPSANNTIYGDKDGIMIFAADANDDASGSNMRFSVDGSEAVRIDSSGNLLVGKTSYGSVTGTGGQIGAGGVAIFTAAADAPLYLNRTSTDGDIVEFYKDGTSVASIGVDSGDNIYITGETGNTGGIYMNATSVYPAYQGSGRDNYYDLGELTVRWDDVYATNGTIQTSDVNEKQDIEELTDAEQRVAVAAKGLLRKYRWKSSVAEKGDEARIHFGIIAQDLKAAFEAEGLDAGRYAMFINSEWTDEETGEPRSRMGVRYNQLLAFIIAAI